MAYAVVEVSCSDTSDGDQAMATAETLPRSSRAAVADIGRCKAVYVIGTMLLLVAVCSKHCKRFAWPCLLLTASSIHAKS